MTPEEKARIKIDQWFTDAGWEVVNRDAYEPTCTAVAIREGLLKGNLEADYFLFINGKAVGVLEAKREETDAFSSGVMFLILYIESYIEGNTTPKIPFRVLPSLLYNDACSSLFINFCSFHPKVSALCNPIKKIVTVESDK